MKAKRMCGFGIREKNLMRFVVFWRISVRFCGFRVPLTPPSKIRSADLVVNAILY